MSDIYAYLHGLATGAFTVAGYLSLRAVLAQQNKRGGR